MTALVLTRRRGETICIGNNIRVCIASVDPGGNVKIVIEAPREIEVHREEVFDKIKAKERLAGFKANMRPHILRG